MTLAKEHDGDLTAAEIKNVAAAGDIPQEHLEHFCYWLRTLVFRFHDETAMFSRFSTRRQTVEDIAKVGKKARELRELLEPQWTYSLMCRQDAQRWLSAGEEPPPEEITRILNQVERDIVGVKAIERRCTSLEKQLASQPESSEERIAAIPAAKPALHYLHHRIRKYWISLGRDPKLSETSLYVQFVRAIYELADEAKDEFETIRSRHDNALRYFETNSSSQSYYR